jgi:two-component system, chemotaxis family, chemotaxis protein CheY
MDAVEKYAALSVLAVDDSPHMLLLLKSMLRGLGVGTVHSVASADEAIGFLRTCLPDVLLVDWMMEGMTGIELARYIRRSEDSLNPYMPMIMVTGHGDKNSIVEARDAGVNEFLVKPLSTDALAEKLAAVVDHPRPFVRTKSYFGPDRRRQDAWPLTGERRQRAITITTPAEIEHFVNEVRARLAEGPVARVRIKPAGAHTEHTDKEIS